jgi:hypothetical protein
MSVNITLPPTHLSGPEDSELESSSGDTQEDETFSDWVDEDVDAPTQSLFDETTHPSALKAVAHDKQTHGVDIVELGTSLSEPSSTARWLSLTSVELNFLKRVRLVNYIRKSVSLK